MAHRLNQRALHEIKKATALNFRSGGLSMVRSLHPSQTSPAPTQHMLPLMRLSVKF
jgi:hypothetical protein